MTSIVGGDRAIHGSYARSVRYLNRHNSTPNQLTTYGYDPGGVWTKRREKWWAKASRKERQRAGRQWPVSGPNLLTTADPSPLISSSGSTQPDHQMRVVS